MDSITLPEIALGRMPEVVPVVPGTHRWNVADTLPERGNLGIELGVAAGSFSARMVRSGRFTRFNGVDVYGDGHNVEEYKKALRRVGLDQNYHLLACDSTRRWICFPTSISISSVSMATPIPAKRAAAP